MPTYEYRCSTCGIIGEFYPIGTAPPATSCPRCGAAATKIFSAPSLRRTPRRLSGVLEQAGKSSDEPAVVRREGDRRQGSERPANPALEKLVGKRSARDLKVARHPAKPR